jgi:hypothetical protein
MATAPKTLFTLEEFEQRYGSEPGWEYWFEEAVRKPTPTVIWAEFERRISRY